MPDPQPYTTFAGDGSVEDGWPTQNQWLSFDAMWATNSAAIGQCPGGLQANTPDETASIKTAIQKAATGPIPAQFILAVLMQESNGCVSVHGTEAPDGSGLNPGLMQDHSGLHACNSDAGVLGPGYCSDSLIAGMVSDGVSGTSSGDGLQQCVNGAPGPEATQKMYQGARVYDSGHLDPSGNLGRGGATLCYASDIASRLMGWTGGSTTCSEATVGIADPTPDMMKPCNSSSANISAFQDPSVAAAQAPAAAAAINSNSLTPPGAAQACSRWIIIQSGDSCDNAEQANSLAAGTLRELNTSVDEACSNLLAGYRYCAAVSTA